MITVGYILPFCIGLLIAFNLPVWLTLILGIVVSISLMRKANSSGLAGLLIANMVAVYWIGYVVGIIWRWINDPQNLGIVDFIKEIFTPNAF